jgi:hypothetical protein
LFSGKASLRVVDPKGAALPCRLVTQGASTLYLVGEGVLMKIFSVHLGSSLAKGPTPLLLRT